MKNKIILLVVCVVLAFCIIYLRIAPQVSREAVAPVSEVEQETVIDPVVYKTFISQKFGISFEYKDVDRVMENKDIISVFKEKEESPYLTFSLSRERFSDAVKKLFVRSIPAQTSSGNILSSFDYKSLISYVLTEYFTGDAYSARGTLVSTLESIPRDILLEKYTEPVEKILTISYDGSITPQLDETETDIALKTELLRVWQSVQILK